MGAAESTTRVRGLHKASKHGDLVTIDRLLGHGDDIKRSSITPSCNVLREVVDRLFNHNEDVNIRDKDGRTPLSYASQEGHYNAIDCLVDQNADVNIRDMDGRTPLSYASKEGHGNAIERLVRQNAVVDTKDRFSMTPLSYASLAGHIDIIDLLVRHGAKVNTRHRDGMTPLGYAFHEGHLDVIHRLLVHHNAGVLDVDNRNLLSDALENKRFGVAKIFIEAGAGINVQDNTGSTPMHTAASRGYVDILNAMLEKDGDENIKNNSGLKPIHLASLWGHSAALRLLLENGTSFKESDPGEVTLMHNILMESPTEITNILIDSWPILTINTPGEFKRTLLHLVACLGNSDLLTSLLAKKDIQVDCRDAKRRNPIHYITEIGDEGMVESLIKAGCKLETVDACQMSVLHLAATHGHDKLIRRFVDKVGVDQIAFLKDSKGRNCLHHAVLYRQVEAVKTILELIPDKRLLDVEDKEGRKPMDYLFEFEKDCLISRYYNGRSVHVKAYSMENDLPENLTTSSSPNFTTVSNQPHLGSIKAIKALDFNAFRDKIRSVVQYILSEAVTEIRFLEVIGCGSSFEGTKNGLPDEFDFMVKLYRDASRFDDSEREGYLVMKNANKKLEKLNVIGSCGLWFWSKLMKYWSLKRNGCNLVFYVKGGDRFEITLPPQRHPEHKTCTTWVWLYHKLTDTGEYSTEQALSIDLVPAIEIVPKIYEGKNGTKTCFIVPKIPHKDGGVRFDDFNQIGRISFPSTEVSYINNLTDRVRNVYITAKCLRSLEVCWFKVKNRNGEPELVKKYVTSYRLKTVFLHLAELFLKSELSLGRMVLMVYEHLERCIERGRLLMFFDPSVNVLAGSKLMPEDSLFVCRLMTKFVRSLYERDYAAQRDQDTSDLASVLRRESVAYGIKRHARAENEDKIFPPHKFLPLYLYDIQQNESCLE